MLLLHREKKYLGAVSAGEEGVGPSEFFSLPEDVKTIKNIRQALRRGKGGQFNVPAAKF